MLAKSPLNILEKFNAVDDAIDANAKIATGILEFGLSCFGVSPDPSPDEPDWRGVAKAEDVEKANTTIRQFWRDWSTEGASERAAHYQPVLEDLDRLFEPGRDRGEIQVLIPGAGLGRLVFEICKAGFRVEGNEISFHALLASNWVLNRLQPAETFDLYPEASRFANQPSLRDQMRKVQIPDVHVGVELDLASRGHKTHAFNRMGMAAADFCASYASDEHAGIYDAVTTVFFIDTAPNIVRYIEAIRHALVEGGCWINLGPLLWHFEARHDVHAEQQEAHTVSSSKIREKPGIEEPGSVELTNEEVLSLVKYMGFEIEMSEMRCESQGYIQDSSSMLQNAYRVSHFVARKAGR